MKRARLLFALVGVVFLGLSSLAMADSISSNYIYRIRSNGHKLYRQQDRYNQCRSADLVIG